MAKYDTTPVGTLVHVNLNTPRDWQDDGRFKYDCCLVLRGPAAAEFQAKVDAAHQDAKKELGGRMAPPPYDQVDDDPEAIRFRFKLRTRIPTKRGLWEREVAFFDSDGTPLEDRPNIGSGTKGQLSYEVRPWKTGLGVGLTLVPHALMVHELVTFEDREDAPDPSNASSFGFTPGAKAATSGPDDF